MFFDKINTSVEQRYPLSCCAITCQDIKSIFLLLGFIRDIFGFMRNIFEFRKIFFGFRKNPLDSEKYLLD